VTHNVYARFRRERLVWPGLSDMRGENRMRDLTFAGSEKIETLAQRSGALTDLASKQAIETGIRNGADDRSWFASFGHRTRSLSWWALGNRRLPPSLDLWRVCLAGLMGDS
jgi:hypothetical protein